MLRVRPVFARPQAASPTRIRVALQHGAALWTQQGQPTCRIAALTPVRLLVAVHQASVLQRSSGARDSHRKDPADAQILGSMNAGPRILIVDDEPNIRDLLTTSLRFAGFAVRAVGNGAQAISAVLEEEPDLIILDVMLPDMNGFGVTKRLRGAGYTAPILFLTAKDDTEDKIMGLTVGGDDYVTKPFSLDEIVARIKAILRRTMQADDDAVIRAGELTMDQDTHEVFVGDTGVELSPTEFKLLRYLMLNPNRVLSKAQILDHVWEYDFNGDAGIVESYISYLRRKVDAHSSEPLIQTKRGFGYMLKAAKA
jgi:two-component system, OmpR family, response regulator